MIDLTQYHSETVNQNTAISNMSQYFVQSKKKKKNLKAQLNNPSKKKGELKF